MVERAKREGEVYRRGGREAKGIKKGEGEEVGKGIGKGRGEAGRQKV